MGRKVKHAHTVKNFSAKRQVIIDLLEVGKKKSMISAIGEVDVTDALEILDRYKQKTGDKISFTSFVCCAWAHTIKDHPRINVHRKGRKKIIIFDDVDVAVVVERRIEGKFQPTSYIVRAANTKSVLEIHNEVRAAQAVKTDNMATETQKGTAGIVAMMPRFLRRIIFYFMSKNPFIKKEIFGNVGLTAIGMFTQRGGTAIPLTAHDMTCVVGGIERKPWVVDDEVKIRNVLMATITMDHDIIDGGPATRFIDEFRERIRNCYGLEEVKALLN
jgi:pyruvate/2-oxoglutarate dehydrogenase complex dihydrolipoamide acyltransferase (E2) component